jgi:hypothetical protein
MTAIDTLERPSGVQPVNLSSERNEANHVLRSRWFHASIERRTISRFSCDIAYSESPAASRFLVRLRERVQAASSAACASASRRYTGEILRLAT